MTELLFTREEATRATQIASKFATRYLHTISDRTVYPAIDRGALREIMSASLPVQGEPLEVLFDELDRVIVPNSTHTAHPRFLPYVQPSPNGLSPFAEFVAATLNQNCNLWTLSPAANAVEQVVVRWFSELCGYGAGARGIITSGGSMANLIGLTAARDNALGATARTQGLQARSSPLTLYASEEVHSSINKAVSTLGIGTDHLRLIATDDAYRIRVDLLADAVARDRAAGLTPFCVVATAGTVTTGAFDPLPELAAFCRKQGMWLHVDGAYGALAALSERFKPSMVGLGEADSISLDPHKFLFTSFEAGCVIVKNSAMLRQAFQFSPSYLAMNDDPDLINFADYGPQLSRGFKALKVWWSLRYYGSEAYARIINRMSDLARQMGAIAERDATFELLAPVTFNCVCFRLSSLNEASNRNVLKALTESGIAFLGPASVKGRFGLRACFMNLRTTEDDVDLIMRETALIGSKM